MLKCDTQLTFDTLVHNQHLKGICVSETESLFSKQVKGQTQRSSSDYEGHGM